MIPTSVHVEMVTEVYRSATSVEVSSNLHVFNDKEVLRVPVTCDHNLM